VDLQEILQQLVVLGEMELIQLQVFQALQVVQLLQAAAVVVLIAMDHAHPHQVELLDQEVVALEEVVDLEEQQDHLTQVVVQVEDQQLVAVVLLVDQV